MNAVTGSPRRLLSFLATASICWSTTLGQGLGPSPQDAAGLSQDHSQSGPAAGPERDTLIRVSSNLVMVPVSVTTSDGRLVEDLGAADFTIEENGRAQRVARLAEPSQVSLDLVLLFDVSGSVNHRFIFEQRAASQFLLHLARSGDSVTLFSIGEEPRTVRTRTSDVQSVVSTLLDLAPTQGPTAFFDSVVMAAQAARASGGVENRRVAVVISDGEENNSTRYGLPDALRAVQEADCIFYAINPMGVTVDVNKVSMEGQRAMEAIALHTGGAAFVTDVMEELPAIFDRIAAELRTQYLLEYYSTDIRNDGRFRTILVRVPERPDLRIRARQGYYAPKLEPRPRAAAAQAPAIGSAIAPADH